jgi:hypothetical protein
MTHQKIKRYLGLVLIVISAMVPIGTLLYVHAVYQQAANIKNLYIGTKNFEKKYIETPFWINFP